MEPSQSHALLNEIVDRLSVGVLVVNKDYELILWNSYMENYSQQKAEEVVGKNLFEAFPDLPRAWLQQKIHNVFVLKNFSFTSWEHRPYLFKFFHNRPITGGVDYMRQNCTFLPIKGEDTEEIEYVCISIFDVTDTSIYEGMLKSAVRSLAEVSNRDGLTNIYNRRYLEQSMSKEFARIKRYGGTLSFVLLDLDHFKSINDNYGHLAGDEILKIAANRISENLRDSDILARYGGEEFAVMLPGTSLNGATILAERLCQNVSKDPVVFRNDSIEISASIGVAEFQTDLDNHEQLISRADEVLYLSKENGRNRVTVYNHNNSTNETIKRSTTEESTSTELKSKTPDVSSETNAWKVNNDASESAIIKTDKLNTEEEKETDITEVDTSEPITIDQQTTFENTLQCESPKDDYPTEITNRENTAQKDWPTEETGINPASMSNTEEPVASAALTTEIQAPEVSQETSTISQTQESIADETTAVIEAETEEEQELTAEEKADLAMIAAYGSEIEVEKVEIDSREDGTIVDLATQDNSIKENKTVQMPGEVKTVYVKLGSK